MGQVSRLFLGNLATEKITAQDLRHVFSKYGKLSEEPVLRRSFGFIQFERPEEAAAAIVGEQGRMMGGLRLGMWSLNPLVHSHLSDISFRLSVDQISASRTTGHIAGCAAGADSRRPPRAAGGDHPPQRRAGAVWPAPARVHRAGRRRVVASPRLPLRRVATVAHHRRRRRSRSSRQGGGRPSGCMSASGTVTVNASASGAR